MIIEGRLQTFDCTAFITATARAHGDADRPDHLPIHNYWDPPLDRVVMPKDGRTSHAFRIIGELGRIDGGRLASSERRLRFQKRCADIIRGLAIHALHMHEFTSIVEDVGSHRAALGSLPVATDARNFLGCDERNLIRIKDVSSPAAPYNKFRGKRRFRLGCTQNAEPAQYSVSAPRECHSAGAAQRALSP